MLKFSILNYQLIIFALIISYQRCISTVNQVVIIFLIHNILIIIISIHVNLLVFSHNVNDTYIISNIYFSYFLFSICLNSNIIKIKVTIHTYFTIYSNNLTSKEYICLASVLKFIPLKKIEHLTQMVSKIYYFSNTFRFYCLHILNV